MPLGYVVLGRNPQKSHSMPLQQNEGLALMVYRVELEIFLRYDAD